jgi:hypothetical protein
VGLAGHLYAHARRAGRVAEVETFQVARALRFPRQMFLREPCWLQIARNPYKCNGNYPLARSNNRIASLAGLGFGLHCEI